MMIANVTKTTSIAPSRAAADDRDEPDHSTGEADNPPERPTVAAATAAIELECAPAAESQVNLSWLEKCVRAAVGASGLPVRRLSVRIVGDAEMQALHRRHLRIDTTTDVLTFAASPPGEPIEADIAVCAAEAARRAGEFGHSVDRELLLYIIHGLLHAAGWDDVDPDAFRRMHQEEDRILGEIGVGATFDRSRAQPADPSREGRRT